jgi:hypothetical protein
MNTQQQALAGKAQQTTVSDELDLRDDLRRDFETKYDGEEGGTPKSTTII